MDQGTEGIAPARPVGTCGEEQQEKAPVTGRVSKPKKGIPTHVCEICTKKSERESDPESSRAGAGGDPGRAPVPSIESDPGLCAPETESPWTSNPSSLQTPASLNNSGLHGPWSIVYDPDFPNPAFESQFTLNFLTPYEKQPEGGHLSYSKSAFTIPTISPYGTFVSKATVTTDDHVATPAHSLDTTEFAPDSGYGSVQAKLDRLKLSRDASTSARVDSIENTTEERTVHSKASNIHGNQLEYFISELAEELAAALPRSLPKELMVTLRNALPSLLEGFAIRLGHNESGPAKMRFACFVHKYREQITEAVSRVLAFEEEEKDDNEVPDLPKINEMSTIDKVSLWQKQQDLPHDNAQDKTSWNEEYDATDDFEEYPRLHAYRSILVHSTAFEWLQSAMLREIQLEIVGKNNAQARIKNQILTALGRQEKISRKEPPKTHRLVFRLLWFSGFFTEQQYDLPAHEAFSRVLVLTGEHNQAWAGTCLEYVRTLWPKCGERIIELFAHLLRREVGTLSSCTLDDDTQLGAKIDATGRRLEILAVGNAFAIAEVGEVLAWLQAAFWATPEDDSIINVVPTCFISALEQNTSETSTSMAGNDCRLLANMSYMSWTKTPDFGNCCWMKLFRNPVLVSGYPTPRHAEARGGIELDLGTMAELIGTRQLSKCTGKPLFKTALAALVPLYRVNDFIYWHMIISSDGEYMSYCDERLKPFLDNAPSGLSTADIERCRHVVGWSTNVKNVTGGPSAEYDIGWSSLKPPSPGCVLEKISIVGGSYITAGVSCVLGKKDKAVHIRSRDDYTMRLKWIAKKYVVLYDVGDRRAWLVDGTSALLHLVRASLKHDASDPFKSLLLYDPQAFQEAQEHQSGKTASIHVLTNPHNLGLPLYSKPVTSREETILGTSRAAQHVTTQTQTYYCFRDRVQGISDVLEQIMAHQADESTQDGIGFRLKTSARRQLEGFDFMDVATDEDPFWPRMTTLRATGRGWVDFTRAIHAITLFGTGFGELVQPIQSEGTKSCEECQWSVAVPKGQDVLAVCVSELQEILQKRGSTKTSPWRLVDDIYWHTPDKTFEACRCVKGSPSKHERMQVLLPSSMPKFWTRGLSSPINLNLGRVSQGAVLFGHSRRFPLRWKDHGQPEEGTPDIEIEEIESSVRDSGLGSSISSGSADNTQDRACSPSPLSFSSPNEAGKRDCGQALLSNPDEGIDKSMAKRRKVENIQGKESGTTTPEIGSENAKAMAGSSRMSNFFDSMSRWKSSARET
ncbi:hypothetical protein PFICI_14806 [Pestalotiopsis fici W106-1]|uniref:Uncharacterized protein n=1 Tax=Pestalotiopsis fici (strain W106-1 / CGMCC3.15140) TaxID=1229662 RepID=W3WIV9_PESFW|nr:uncharacterized protein PFICI_14806 [Pestalotiopsis fici W106-1]ETS73860.1 hypothetical protein PFICI_14806 [Pestalotiopsis fici W106-1]